MAWGWCLLRQQLSFHRCCHLLTSQLPRQKHPTQSKPVRPVWGFWPEPLNWRAAVWTASSTRKSYSEIRGPDEIRTHVLRAQPLSQRKLLVPEQGLEPWTHWLRISCSANWATRAFSVPQDRFELSTFPVSVHLSRNALPLSYWGIFYFFVIYSTSWRLRKSSFKILRSLWILPDISESVDTIISGSWRISLKATRAAFDVWPLGRFLVKLSFPSKDLFMIFSFVQLPDTDSNCIKHLQRVLCYHYTIGQF